MLITARREARKGLHLRITQTRRAHQKPGPKLHRVTTMEMAAVRAMDRVLTMETATVQVPAMDRVPIVETAQVVATDRVPVVATVQVPVMGREMNQELLRQKICRETRMIRVMTQQRRVALSQ